jgi:hypothetical protein
MGTMASMPRWLLIVTLVIACHTTPPLASEPPADADGDGASRADATGPGRDGGGAGLDTAALPDAALMEPDAPAGDAVGLFDSAGVTDGTDAGESECPMAPRSAFTACTSGVTEPIFVRKRDGQQCGVCTITIDQVRSPVSGCYWQQEPELRLHCVQSCAECCYARAEAPCKTDGDCCQPLRCLVGPTGKVCGK